MNFGDARQMVTGNCFKRFSEDSARLILAELITDEGICESFKEIHLGLCAIVCVIHLQQRKVKLVRFRPLCTRIHIQIVKTFIWAQIPTTMHNVLAHIVGIASATMMDTVLDHCQRKEQKCRTSL